MAEIIKTEVKHMPKVKFIGRRYTEKDYDSSKTFGRLWGTWFEQGLFEKLKVCNGLKDISDDFIGLMRCTKEGYEYWIGIFMAPDDVAPEGFQEVLIDEGDVFVCYIYGSEASGEIYGGAITKRCFERLRAEGHVVPNEVGWQYEGYNCPRFTKPDDKGNVILDYGIYIEK